jgi:hypothetical protein
MGRGEKGPSSSSFFSFLSSAEDAVQQSPHKSLRWEFRRTASKAISISFTNARRPDFVSSFFFSFFFLYIHSLYFSIQLTTSC